MDYYKKSIDLKNNLSGFYNLGFIYENGYGVDVNYAKAYEIYNEGVKLYELQSSSDEGISALSDEENYNYMIDFINQYSLGEKQISNLDKDEDTSQEILTCGYIEEYVQAGYDQTNNFDKCYDFAESGNKDAQFYIGYFYNNGLVVNKNFSTAAYWYRKAIDNGDMIQLLFS